MEKVKITEIAQELGSTSKDVYQKAILMSINVKSTRSSVSIEEAQKIFDAILYNKEQTTKITLENVNETIEEEYCSFYKKGKLYISLTNQSIDLEFNQHIVNTFESNDVDNFLLFSYCNSDENLKSNFKDFFDDFDVGTVSDEKPLENLEYYAKRYNPKAILIDGIDFKYLDENFEKLLTLIKKVSIYKIKYNFGVVNISKEKQSELIKRINKFFINNVSTNMPKKEMIL
ncbi:MAG: translation initiation factor IF-2 N-terminal domain-containing protein [Arcobacteraceae bacterium]